MKKNNSENNIPKNSSLIIFLFLISLTIWTIFLYLAINSIEHGTASLAGWIYGIDAFWNVILIWGLFGWPVFLPTLVNIIIYIHKYLSLSLICKRYLILCIGILILKIIKTIYAFQNLIYEIKILGFTFELSMWQIFIIFSIFISFILFIISLIFKFKKKKNKD